MAGNIDIYAEITQATLSYNEFFNIRLDALKQSCQILAFSQKILSIANPLVPG